jgi:hypothetical protein
MLCPVLSAAAASAHEDELLPAAGAARALLGTRPRRAVTTQQQRQPYSGSTTWAVTLVQPDTSEAYGGLLTFSKTTSGGFSSQSFSVTLVVRTSDGGDCFCSYAASSGSALLPYNARLTSDSITILESLDLECSVAGPPATCSAQLRRTGKALCAHGKVDEGVDQSCRKTELIRGQRFTSTSDSVSCAANPAASTVMAVVDCGSKGRYELKPQLLAINVGTTHLQSSPVQP